MDTTTPTLAEQLYAHYCHARGGHDEEGLRMPCWPALPARERDVWVRFAQLSYWASVRTHLTDQVKVDPDDLTVRASVRTKAEAEHEHVPVPPRAEGIGPVTVTPRAPATTWDWTQARTQQVVACSGHGCDPDGGRHGGGCPIQSAPPAVPVVCAEDAAQSLVDRGWAPSYRDAREDVEQVRAADDRDDPKRRAGVEVAVYCGPEPIGARRCSRRGSP